MTSSEYLSKDILEEDFMKVFVSFRWLQLLMGSSRVDAKDRFVTAPTMYQKMYTIICSTASAALSVASIFVYANKFHDYPSMFNLCMAALILHIMVYLSNMVHVRFIHNNANVKFLLKLQETDRLMKIENNKFTNTVLYVINNISMGTLFIIFVTLLSLASAGGLSTFIGYLGLAWNQGVFVTEISYCSNLVVYFFLRTRFVNAIIANHIKPVKKGEKRHNFHTRAFMKWLADQSHDFTTSRTDVYLKEIFHCFSSYQEICRFQIFLFFFNYVSFTLISFEFIIQSLMYKVAIIPECVVIITILIVNTFQAMLLCFRCDRFYKEIDETKRLCVAIMAQYHNGPLRKTAKNMLNLIEQTPPSFSVYDMWQLDAHLMLKVFNVITTFLVTLLQFAFL